MYMFIARQILFLDYLGGAITCTRIVKVFEISTSKHKKFTYFTQLLSSYMYSLMMATMRGRNM
jgi:hypothetical protein